MLLLVVAFLVRKGLVKVFGRVPDLPRNTIASLRDAMIYTVGQKYFISRHRKRLDEGRINQHNDSSVSVRQY